MADAPEETDFFALAHILSKEEFTARCPWFFIVGQAPLVRPRAPRPTIVLGTLKLPDQLETGAFDAPRLDLTATGVVEEEAAVRYLVVPVRKVRPVFPFMITLGRTVNNDMVVPDIMVSKFHAYFRVIEQLVELTDAGSRNGTFVGDRKLQPNGPPVRVSPGDVVRFGPHAFDFLSSEACWERLRTDSISR